MPTKSIPPRHVKPVPNVTLPPDRFAAFREAALALSEDQIRHPSRQIDQRIAWAEQILEAARRAGPDLLRVPMEPEPDISAAEIELLAEQLQFLRQVDGALRGARGNVLPPEAQERIAEARGHQHAVLVGVQFLFRRDAKVQRQIRDIRQGSSLADLMQDASRLWALWKQHSALCRKLIKGESARLTRLIEITNELSQITASLPQGRELRALRDRAYTLTCAPIERLREAASYLFWDQPERLAEFAPFRPPTRAKKARNGRSSIPPAAPVD